MAARATSAFYHFALILNLFILINYSTGERFGDRARTLHIVESDDSTGQRKPLIINKNTDDSDDFETPFVRDRRDVSPNPDITTKVNALNDSHQQLMVHWVGEGSNVIICLARDSTPLVRLPVSANPSAVYISYDYGETFENKTEKFKISDSNDPNVGYATLDKFYNHPKYNTHCVFADSSNQLIFTTWNNGKDITRQNLPFHPSDISFHEDDPLTFLALDKIDPERKLWLTRDLGKTWVVIQEYVKAFFWTSTQPKALLVERHEPTGVNAVLSSTSLFQSESNFAVLIRNVEDFQVRGDYMFATTKSGDNDLDLHISYKQRPFVEAQFNSELVRRDYHIADVSNNRVLVAVSHTEFLVNLYVSEIIANEQIAFTLSLERIVTFFPNSTWKDSWLNEVSDEAFTDLYKVEGLRGIYIASQVKEIPKDRAIGPEHLISLITYDHGASWNTIKAPAADNDGFLIPCHEDCYLHLSQKFSQLYPATRSVSIMSSKSAPGIILATGVIGKSLKGHPGVFISRDAGLTWKQVLKDYYFFNMGDHGGVLVAVKYFKSRGETRDILYSTDEGETWHPHEFNGDLLRVYGLMTEPGENTTVFTMFGSANGQHQWLIVKVDLRNVFERNCTQDDFKFWSPSSTDQPTMACVLGRKETYQRRAMRANCYTGANYDRPVKLDICQCDAKDYQCDFGFTRNIPPYHCIRNKSYSSGLDPYAIPQSCKPGLFYNRTKGYRKIEDDDCSGGLARNFEPDEIPCPMREISEFLLVAQRDHISRIDLKELKLEALPVHGLKNVIAIEFDLIHNCLYWADIVNDTIGRQCLQDGTSYPEILVETDLSSIEGMALDWISKVLYFVDGVKMRIEIIRVDVSTMGRMRRTILGSDKLKKPRGIAVHPMNGFMFWTDWAPGDASVSRANLDGSNVKRLFNKDTVEWPNGITIDHIAERIYWVDAKLDYIGSSDLDGQRFKKILAHDDRLAHPFAVAVFKDNMYWDDWKQSMIFLADKDHGLGLTTIMGQLVGLMDLKVFANSVQVGTNKCANNTVCSHICLGAPNNEFVCLCPDGMEKDSAGKCTCPGGKLPYANSTCPRVASTCAGNQYACSNGVCVPELWKCDGDNDCGDNSDELHCNRASCEPNHFSCDQDKCIPKYWVCDFDNDCKDNTDELNCRFANCTDAQFKCDNGQCISRRWYCDGENDCRDGSDEKNCSSHLPSTCETGQFLCNKTNYQTCIPMAWRCDGESDCENATDEAYCDTQKCEDWQFACKSTKRCIYQSWVCDGDSDCPDGSDEVNCTISTPSPPLPPSHLPNNSCSDWMFRCNNKKCVPYWWKCDSVDDCGDNSDEIGCGNPDGPTAPPRSTEHPRTCREHQFQCYDGECIVESWVCDGSPDCSSGEDEIHCDGVTIKCREDQFKCRSDGSCVALTNVCNGVTECPDDSDELGCEDHVQTSPAPVTPCSSGSFPCDQTRCLPKTSFCDGNQDCYDGFDEKDCDKSNIPRVYQVLIMGVDERSTNATSLFLFWWMPIPNNVTFEFLPSISKAEPSATWTNATNWIENTEYQFNDLEPYTKYNMTVYVKLKNQNSVFPPAKYLTVITGEGTPSPPWNVTVTQMNGTRVEVSWRPPLHPNGPIMGYKVFATPPIPPKPYYLQKTSQVVDIPFQAGVNYSFWVIAKNRKHESNSSIVATLMFDGAANIDNITNLVVTATTNSTVTLTWDKILNVSGYHVTPDGPEAYPDLHPITISTNSIVVRKLAPGTKYTFDVNAFKNNYVGKAVRISATTTGTPLPSVPNLQTYLMKDQGTTVKLSWDPPKDSRKIKWQYGVYYALNMKDLLREVRTVTPNLTAAIKNLEACETYMFAIGLVGDFGVGPLNPPVMVSTHYNIRAAPKNLRVTTSDRKYEIIVSWSSSCRTIDVPIAYTITITEMTFNRTSTVSTLATNETTLKHRFGAIHYGGKYEVRIATDVDNAISSQPVIYVAPPILSPHQLKVLPEESSYIVYWQEHDLAESITNDTKYHYDVLVSEGERVINQTTAKIFKVDEPPFIYQDAKTDVIYSFAVRLVTEDGYRSELSETVSTQNPGSAKPLTIYTSNVLSFAIPICLLVVALGAALGYFVVRHRRLSNSFTQFANSHYDTRRGQATFPGTTDGLDDEDSPVIRGFSDDEPLVIA